MAPNLKNLCHNLCVRLKSEAMNNTGWIRRAVVSLGAAVAVAAASVVLAWAIPADAPVPEPVSPVAAAEGTCPATVVVAARGSEQNRPEDVPPTRHSPRLQRESNGWEGTTLRYFFNLVEYRNPGSFDDAYVLGLEPGYYPAKFPMPEVVPDGHAIVPFELIRRIAEILHLTPPSVIAGNAVNEFVDSLQRAIPGVPRAIADYEAQTGCQPHYLLVGYSQGAVALAAAEKAIDEQTGGRVAGVLTIGAPPKPAGLIPYELRALLQEYPMDAVTERRLDYCRSGDVICESTWKNAVDALASGGIGVHADYFKSAALDPGQASTSEAAVADQFAGWLRPQG